jgi:hypothetical protein
VVKSSSEIWAPSVIYKKSSQSKQSPDRRKFDPIWDRCYDYLNIFAKKFGEKLAFLTQNKAKLCKILIITLVFEKKRHFFRHMSPNDKNQNLKKKLLRLTKPSIWPSADVKKFPSFC